MGDVSEPEVRAVTGESNPPAYNSVWKLRSDAWGRLDTIGEQLAAAPSARGVAEEAGALFELLEPIEHYWAFPGPRRLERARRLFAGGISIGSRM
jgi:arginine decarboxylase